MNITGNDGALEDLLLKASRAERENRLTDARRLLVRCLELDSAHPIACYRLSVLALQAGHVEEAQRLNTIAISKAPNEVHVVVHAARIARQRGDLREARTLFERAIVLDPDQDAARNELNLVLRAAVREPGDLSSTKDILQDDKSSEGLRAKELLRGLVFDIRPPFSAFLGDLEIARDRQRTPATLAARINGIGQIAALLVFFFFVIPNSQYLLSGSPIDPIVRRGLATATVYVTLLTGWTFIVLPVVYLFWALLRARNAHYQCVDGLLRIVGGAIGQRRGLYEIRHIVQIKERVSLIQRITGDCTLELLVSEGRGADTRVRLVGFASRGHSDEMYVYQMRELSNLLSVNQRFKGLRI